MTLPARSLLSRLWPRSLFGRIAIILFFGLAASHVMSFWMILHERDATAMTMMVSYVARDVATAVAVLERVPATERTQWLKKFERRNYRYAIGTKPESLPAPPVLGERLAQAIGSTVGPNFNISASGPNPGETVQLRLHFNLSDGTPVSIDVYPPRIDVSIWVPLTLLFQLVLFGLFTWIAVRLATRPLNHLARAADTLGPQLRGKPLPETGPLEVARAAVAFNAMQRRISDHLAERLHILAAVSHDLQTPITRMRLRTDLLDNATLRDKLQGDLRLMQMLVEEGVAYARSAESVTETPVRTDLNALLDSIVFDYTDANHSVRLIGKYDQPITLRPHTLRRVLTNLIDNALKFGTDAEIAVGSSETGHVTIAVRDRGPGIPPAEFEAVLRPFYRIENSRNRNTGGTGLGLAIAQQLVQKLGGTLTLSNREEGGLEVRLSLPAETQRTTNAAAEMSYTS